MTCVHFSILCILYCHSHTCTYRIVTVGYKRRWYILGCFTAHTIITMIMYLNSKFCHSDQYWRYHHKEINLLEHAVSITSCSLLRNAFKSQSSHWFSCMVLFIGCGTLLTTFVHNCLLTFDHWDQKRNSSTGIWHIVYRLNIIMACCTGAKWPFWDQRPPSTQYFKSLLYSDTWMHETLMVPVVNLLDSIIMQARFRCTSQ